MRGKPELNEKTIDEIRITPADAGKTQLHFFIYLPFQDHPRGCGENIDVTE